MIRIRLLKRRRREVNADPNLGGQWNVPKLGGQWNVPKLGGQWNVPSLVANGMWRKNTFSPLPTFPLTTYLNLQFFDLEVLLYHGSRSLLTPFFHFHRFKNYDYTSWCNKSFTLSLSIWFWLKIWPFFSFPWKHGIVHGHIVRAPSHTNKWKIAFEVISRSDPNVASSWWKTQTSRGAHSSWN